MEYIKRSKTPELLTKNKEKWTQPWIDYYLVGPHQKRPKKPNDSHWTKKEIRNILIADFHNNCGYCGVSRPTPNKIGKKERTPRGHVDHYRAKAVYPHLTYEWSNYIWSCEACNVEKGEFDDPKEPLMNPCILEDCMQLNFIIDTGQYVLKKESTSYKKRFDHTDKVTMLNADEFSKRRRNRAKSLKKDFESISHFISLKDSIPLEHLVKGHIETIIESLEDPEFFFLMQRIYHDLREQYPMVAEVIDQERHSY